MDSLSRRISEICITGNRAACTIKNREYEGGHLKKLYILYKQNDPLQTGRDHSLLLIITDADTARALSYVSRTEWRTPDNGADIPDTWYIFLSPILAFRL